MIRCNNGFVHTKWSVLMYYVVMVFVFPLAGVKTFSLQVPQ